MSWSARLDRDRLDLRTDRVPPDDGERQLRTAAQILKRLERQPGVVLADEVGMGKTFVALAVAASAHWADRQRRPVVVMVPSSLEHKWPRDFSVFRERCVRLAADRDAMRHERARSGTDLLRLLGRGARERPAVVTFPHGALYRSVRDPWIKLAILRQALRTSSLTRQRRAFVEFARRILVLRSRQHGLLVRLLRTPIERWSVALKEEGEEPIPAAVIAVLRDGENDLRELREALSRLPLRSSESLDERLKNVRSKLRRPLDDLWRSVLRQVRFSSPLLILDEAHHLKNPATRLASLFVDEEDESDRRLLGALAGHFERMLFLTATPFQLGHAELLNVLDRFKGVRWRKGDPEKTRDDFRDDMARLRESLDAARSHGSRLDRKWGGLRSAQLGAADLESWWQQASTHPERQSAQVQEVLRSYDQTRQAMRDAERLLSPWVIRHRRPRQLAGHGVARRVERTGAAIRNRDSTQGTDGPGLPIADAALLPFLLAARAQSLATRTTQTPTEGLAHRLTFAEDLASSYEAFLSTRKPTGERRLMLADEVSATDDASGLDSRRSWYLKQLQSALPNERSYGEHPKVAATVERTLELWREREKVVIFCHWRATGSALLRHISRALDDDLRTAAAARLGCLPREVDRLLGNISSRFEPGRPVHKRLAEILRELLRGRSLSAGECAGVEDIVTRFVRERSFLARYYPLAARNHVAAFEQALDKHDGSRRSLREKLDDFIGFLAGRTDSERAEYLARLKSISTRRRSRRRAEAGAGRETLPNVRLANGEVKDATRRNLLFAFNTPFFPEILIASSVLAEGVDLHLDCRFVIHHDLAWNPSTLEQRTGRVDRLGAKAERVGHSIEVDLPYVAATQDEKMFRVVRDRERWFQAVMGRAYTLDQALDDATTDAIEERLPLPESAARDLGLKLEV